MLEWKNVFFQNIFFRTANWEFKIFFQMMGAYFRQGRKQINQKAQSNQKWGQTYPKPPYHLVVKVECASYAIQ